jgi:hypothetical protein
MFRVPPGSQPQRLYAGAERDDGEMTGGRCAREEAKRAARGPEASWEDLMTG